jgi:FkbM family methyltransferase
MPSPPPTDRSEAAFIQGLAHHRGGRLAEAIGFYDQALALRPDHVGALVNKGAALRGLGRQAPALACYWQALAVEPANIEARVNAANALLDQQRGQEAAALAQTALALAPLRPEAWSVLASALLQRRKIAAAEACLMRAVALSPDRVDERKRLDAVRMERRPPVDDEPPATEWAAELEALAGRKLPPEDSGDIVVHSVFPEEFTTENTEITEEGDRSSCAERKKRLSAQEEEIVCASREAPLCVLRGETFSPSPRFRMTVPRAFLSDPGIRYLVDRERRGVGYEYASRSFLDAHLEPGDLFIDVGAHWGIMSLQAVTRWPGQVMALAIEPLPGNLPHLQRWLADNGVADRVEIVAAAASNLAGRGSLRPESTMGHSLIKAEAGEIDVVTIDGLLSARPHLAGRRVIVKIDVEGSEIDVIDGMAGLLASGRVAAVLWERGIEYDKAAGRERQTLLRQRFADLGFSAWCFRSEDEAGALEPFEAEDRRNWHGNVIELAPGLTPLSTYGEPRPPTVEQPEDPVTDAALKAKRLFQEGLDAQKARKAAEAARLYREAGRLDPRVAGLFNNIGVLLREQSRLKGAIAAYRRALEVAPEDISVLSNLANVLREQGNFALSQSLHEQALARTPGSASLLYNAGVLEKDAGRPERAIALFDRALAIAPANADYRWDRALALLQAGDYRRGFPAYESRWDLKRAHKRKLPTPFWDGTPLDGRSIFLSDEQGFGDVLQFARFIPEVKRRGAGRIVLECQPELMRLMALTPGVDAVVPRAKSAGHSDWPKTDCHSPLLGLPVLFGTTLATLPAEVPYLTAPSPDRILADDRALGGRLKLGLVWAGKTAPRDRSCSLEFLLPLLGDPRFAAYSLQVGPRAADLKSSGADALVTDLAPALHDFAETAAMLRQLDLLITVDTAVAHLAGALGVRTFLLLRFVSDWRWFDHRPLSPWYPSFTLFRQDRPGHWEKPLAEVAAAMEAFAEKSGVAEHAA